MEPISRFGRWLRSLATGRQAGAAMRLDTCPACGEGFVYPVTWTEWGSGEWLMLLRCGGCGSARDVVAGNDAAEAFDELLDEQMAVIRAAADRLELEALEAQTESFVTALRLDLVRADDFR